MPWTSARPLLLLDTSLTDGQPPIPLPVSLLLALLGLTPWLLVDRARRRRAGRELFARLVVLEADRARAQMAAAGGPAAPRGRGATPPRRREPAGRASAGPRSIPPRTLSSGGGRRWVGGGRIGW